MKESGGRNTWGQCTKSYDTKTKQQQKIKMTHNYLNKNRQVLVRIGPVNR